MNRSALRENVFKIMFRYEFHNLEEFAGQVSLYLEQYPETSDDDDTKYPELSEDDRETIKGRVMDVAANITSIDEAIEKATVGWKIGRIGKAELAILRVAVYEIMYDDKVDTAVAINEAVNLSKKYCDDKTHSFVNGVLAKFTK